MVPRATTPEEPHSIIDACVVYAEFLGGPKYEEVRRRTGQLSLTSIIRTRHLKLFGHMARAYPSMDHNRALHRPA